MSEYKKVKIGDFLTEREGRYKPDDKKISNYKRLEKIDFSGVIHISDKPSKTDMIIVHPGDLVISGINVAKGAVAVYQGNAPVCATIHYSSEFMYLYLCSRYEESRKVATGGNQAALSGTKISQFLFSLPPLAEQKRIITLVSSYLSNIEKLEYQISQREEYANQLMQSILKDAFEER